MDFTVTAWVNGRQSTLPNISFEDETSSYGQIRTDTQAIGIASGTPFVVDLEGTYSYTFTESPNANQYKYSIKISNIGGDYYYTAYHSYLNVSKRISIPSTQFYSSEAEVRRILGRYATELLLDDDDEARDSRDIWESILSDVGDTIDMYLAQNYDLTYLYNNSWVRRRATILAVNLLSSRRGNSPLYLTKTERTYEELEAIRDGRFHVPGATSSGFQGPAVRNYLLQNRYKRHPLRVEKSKSTGDNYTGEDVALEPYVY